jgi:ABC-type microcin C transport system permease subunit YejB
VIGLYTSYAAPIFLRITPIIHGRDELAPDPFSLGRWAAPVGVIAVAWVSFIVVMLFLPPGQDTAAEEVSKLHIVLRTLRLFRNVIQDYLVAIIVGVFIFASASWILSARKWFSEPVKIIDDMDTPSEPLK